MITIDGSLGEGGGSVLRQALALSIHTGKPFRIQNIRKNRPNPGINYQHLASIEIAQKVSNAKVLGARINSTELEFYPGELSNKEITVDIGSAGSVVLAIQSAFLPCLLSGKKFKFNLIGGTDVSWSPPVDYFKEIFLCSLEDYGKFDCQVQKRGFYPKGGGLLSLTIQGNNNILNQDNNKGNINNSHNNKSFQRTELGKLIALKGIINTSKNFFEHLSPENFLEISKISLSGLEANVNVTLNSSLTDNEGASFLFYAIFENPSTPEKFLRIGVSEIAKDEDELLKKIEDESKKLKSLISEKIPVDDYLADQLISFISIIGGKLKTNSISNHTLSNIYVAELFLNKKIEINNKEKTISA
ncbi:MAG: RNA 3'-terminal phosphate cyclase [Candidatus Nanoarchaeia archaeon]